MTIFQRVRNQACAKHRQSVMEQRTWPACAAISPSALLRLSEVLALPGLPLGCSVMSLCHADPARQAAVVQSLHDNYNAMDAVSACGGS